MSAMHPATALGRVCTSGKAMRMNTLLPATIQHPFHVPSLRRPIDHPSQSNPGRTAVQARVIIRQRVERTDDDIQEVLFTPEQLNEILDDLGRQIGNDYKDKHLLVLGVLKGGFMFTSDLIRHVNPVPLSMEVDFFKAASYGMGIHSTGQIKLDDAFDLSIVKDRHVLVTEDIIDTGLTMNSIVTLLRKAGAMSVRVAVLLDKRARRSVTFDADYVGIVCPDQFVVGYGIDFAERYRWLPYIGVPKPEVVEALAAERKQQEEKERERYAREQAQRIAAETAAIEQQKEPVLAHSNGRSNGYSNKHMNGNGHSNGHSNGNGHHYMNGHSNNGHHRNGNGNGMPEILNLGVTAGQAHSDSNGRLSLLPKPVAVRK